MSRKLCCYDLPGKLRDSIYEYYAADADKTTVCFARGAYLEPPLALVTRQIRKEFIDHWSSQEHLCEDTRHLKIAVFNLDWTSAASFWEKAIALKRDQMRGFESACITVVLTKAWDNEEAKKRTEGFLAWFWHNAWAVCADEHEVWQVLDYRRFGRLKATFFCLSLARNPAKWKWKAIFDRAALLNPSLVAKKWWHGSVRGARSGRCMK